MQHSLKYLFSQSATLTLAFVSATMPALAQPEDQTVAAESSSQPVSDAVDHTIAQTADLVDRDNGWYVSAGPSLVFGYPVDVASDGDVPIVTPPIFPGGPAVNVNIPIDISIYCGYSVRCI